MQTVEIKQTHAHTYKEKELLGHIHNNKMMVVITYFLTTFKNTRAFTMYLIERVARLCCSRSLHRLNSHAACGFGISFEFKHYIKHEWYDNKMRTVLRWQWKTLHHLTHCHKMNQFMMWRLICLFKKFFSVSLIHAVEMEEDIFYLPIPFLGCQMQHIFK